MAIKKSEIYSSLDASCDKLRGGMDPSQYKNYILSLLFMKYVTVKFKGKPYPQVTVPEGGSFDDLKALRNQDNIGEGVDKAFAKLSEANDQLSGIFRDVHFNDYTKLGKGKEMVKKITDLIDIFCRPEFDLEKNRAGGDDLLGDTYEYLMRKFAVESGKSKGQFLTPAEASRVLAGVLGIADVKARSEGWSIYDPACGSGSLLIRAADAAQCPVGIFGQEKDVTTAGLAKMNLVLHNKATGTIKTGNTFSEPQYLDTENGKTTVKRFDFAVVNPPFSLKNWKDGYKDFGRMEGFGATPPDKNGDYAWLMHVIKSLKQDGRAAVILPLGVLSRGKAEEAIRKNIVDRGLIEGIIIFPPNIFFGTGIPACVLVLSKIGAGTRAGIFMVDASGGFVKDKDKNRLRERDIEKIVSTYKQRRVEPHYSRFVQWGEIKVKNAYNLNMPRYITSGVKEDVQDLDAHMNGGIPSADIDGLDAFWTAFPHLRRRLFAVDREGYETPKVGLDEVREAIQSDKEFVAYAEKVAAALTAWEKAVEGTFSSIAKGSNPKKFIRTPAQKLMEAFAELKLLDVFDVYEVLLSYWNATMADDVYVISDVGYAAGREIEEITRESENKKTGDMKKTVVGWDGKIIPRSLLDKTYFAKEAQAVADAETKSATAKAAFEEFVGAATGEDGALSEYLGLDGKLDTKRLAKDAKKAKADGDDDETSVALVEYVRLEAEKKATSKAANEAADALEALEKAKYPALSDKEVKDLIVRGKWFAAVRDGVNTLYHLTSEELAEHVTVLQKRYASTFGALEDDSVKYGERLKSHVEKVLQTKGKTKGRDEWAKIPFTDCFELHRNNTCARAFMGSSGTIQNIHYGDILVKYGAVVDFNKEEVPYLTEDGEKCAPKDYLKDGDIVIADTAEDEIAGKVVEVRGLGGRKATAGLHTVMCRPKDSEMFEPGWLGYWMNSKGYHDQLISMMTGIKVLSLSRANFAKTYIYVPKREEQRRIIATFNDADLGIATLERKLAKYRQLKSGMMSELLTGNVRLGEGK